MSNARIAALLFAAAFLVRLVSWMGAAVFGTDGCHYLLMADWFLEGRFGDALRLAYHPLYPLLIAAGRVLIGDTVQSGALVAVLLGAAAVIPLYRLVARCFGGPAAFIAGLLFAFNPSLIEVHSDVMTEGPFLFFLLFAMDLTWGMMEAPSIERAATLGLCAAAAYLTRPEGLLSVALAVGWPAIELLRRRDRVALRLGGLALLVAVIVVAVAPYLFWIRSVKGGAALSMRPSVDSAARVLAEPGAVADGRVFVVFLKGIYRLTYLVTIPFYVVGLWELRKTAPGKTLFYFSLPLGYFAGLLFALQVHTFMTYRYVTAPMSLMMALPALGLVATFRAMARRRPDARWRPAACGALLLLLAVAPCARAFEFSKRDLLGVYDAARWIAARGTRPRGLSGPAQQVAYLAGCPSRYSAVTPEGLRSQIRGGTVDYYVYSERDVGKRPEYVAMLRSCDLLDPPVAIDGPPGSVRLYLQRVR